MWLISHNDIRHLPDRPRAYPTNPLFYPKEPAPHAVTEFFDPL
jgi:hypothetical protein